MRPSGWHSRMTAVMAILMAMTALGCRSLTTSGIDPTGEHVLASPPAPYPNPYELPPSPLPSDPVKLTLTPSVMSAPIGSEVLLIAGVVSADGHLRCNQRLEWIIAQGSVGQFTDIGKNDFVDMVLGDYNRPRLVNAVFGVGSTASRDEQVKRSPQPGADEIAILPGQGWIKIASPVEGVSTVTVTAAKIASAAEKTKTATIYWTDASWRFPPPAINSAGSKHSLTTTVMRQSNQSPCPGWVVKYTIAGGPPAGFSPDGASSIEVATDAAGQATAEILQKAPAHGTNQIGIEVIRPAELPGAAGQRLTVGSGSVMQTWTAAEVGLKLSGPSMAKAGDTLNYRFDLSNAGDLPSKDVLLSSALPDGLSYLSSSPAAGMVGRQLQWRVAELGPRQHQVVDLSTRAEREGSVSLCADLTTGDGLKLNDCAMTTITAAAQVASPGPMGGGQMAMAAGGTSGGIFGPVGGNQAASTPAATGAAAPQLIELKVEGPRANIVLRRDAPVKVTFNITVINRSQSNLDKLLIKDHFDTGLEYVDQDNKVLKSPIDTDLGDLPAGRRSSFNITFLVRQAGNLCHTVEVIRQGNTLAKAQACVTVSAQATPPPGIATPGAQTTSPSTSTQPQSAAPPNRLQNPQGARPSPPANAAPSAGAAPPSITLKQTGPKGPQTVGDKVSFVSQISNPNPRALTNVKIVYHFDRALLFPKMATNHFRVENNDLVWMLPQLPAGSYTQIEVQYECRNATLKAGNAVGVTCGEGAQAQDTAYVEIRPAAGGAQSDASTSGGQPPPAAAQGAQPGGAIPGGTLWSAPQRNGEKQGGEYRPGSQPAQTSQPATPLTMTVASLHPQVAAGKELTFLIMVVNNTGATDHEVIITALVPDGMTPVGLGTKGPGPTQFDINRQIVAFDPVMSIAPGETLTYQVRVRAKSAGQQVFRAKLTSQNSTQGIVQEASTEVFESEGQKQE
jgi:uncharacterized repeat protein (TIGR01451 family)